MNESIPLTPLEIARTHGVVRASDLAAHSGSRMTLTRLVQQGKLERIARGEYALPGASHTQRSSLAVVAERVPRGVICLLSALEVHGLTGQVPFEVWLAVQRDARKPKLQGIALRVVYFSGLAFTAGIETYKLEDAVVRVYGAAKSVADAFKYRHKIGLDVALEALREGLKRKAFTRDEFWYFAGICRVRATVRPYLEALSL